MVSPPSLFLYEPRIVRIWSVSPNRGTTSGGTEITIVGEGFEGIATGGPVVDLGGASALVTEFSDTRIVATTDPHAEEVVDVTVTNSDGDSGTLAGAFDYTDGTPPIDVVFRTPAGAVARLARVENSPAKISQALGQPSTMTFTSPLEPAGLDPVAWTCYGQLLFDGVITGSEERTEGKEKSSVWDVSCINNVFLLAKRYPVGEWESVDASSVLTELMSEFGRGFSTSIEPALGQITAKLDGSRDLWTVICDICEKVGAKAFLASTTLVVFSSTSTYDPPAAVTDDNTDLLWPENGQAVKLSYDYTQLANSVTIYGADGVSGNIQSAESIAIYGVCPLPVYDNTLTTVQECLERAQSIVDSQALPIPTARYSTRDLKTMAGKAVTISLSTPPIDDEWVIAAVEIDQLEMLAVGHKPRFSVTCVPPWAPAMKVASPAARMLQKVADVIGDQDKQPRLTGDITSEPGGRTTIQPGTITNEHLAGCITTDQQQPGPLKDPVVAASTGALVLSGLQTVGGVALQEGDRVLVKDQADPSENGIYIASAASGLWSRASDADSDAKMPPGILVANSADGKVYYLDADEPVEVGTTSLSFVSLTAAVEAAIAAIEADVASLETGLAAAEAAISTLQADVDALEAAFPELTFKSPVRAATTADITLSGNQTIDGVALVDDDRVLVKAQTAPEDNGIYVVASGAWSRSADANTSAKVVAGLFVVSTEGTVNADKCWLLTTDNPIVLGTTELVFAQISGSGGGGSAAITASVSRSSDQTLTHNVEAAISFNTADFDDEGMWSGGAPTRLTITEDGDFKFNGQITVGADFAGQAHVRLYKNGALVAEGTSAGGDQASGQESYGVEWLGRLVATDYVELKVMLFLYGGVGSFDVVGGANKTFLQVLKPGGGGSSLSAGDGIDITSGVVSVKLDGSTLSASGSGLKVTTPFVAELLEEETAAAGASMNFTTRNKNGYTGDSFQSDFDEYILELLNIVPATNLVDFCIRMSTNGGSSYDSGNNYVNSIWVWNNSGSAASGHTIAAPTSKFVARNTAEINNDANYGLCGTIRFFAPGSSKYKRLNAEYSYAAGSGTVLLQGIRAAHVYLSATAVNAFQLFFSSGNMTGTARLYGVPKQ